MSFVRTVKKDNPFVQIDKSVLNDDRLTFEAKGIMAYILSKPDGWQIRKKDLIKRSASGQTKVETAMLELMATGYLNWYRERLENGEFGDWIYDVYERPEYNPNSEKSIAEGQRRIAERKNKTKNKNRVKNVENTEESAFPPKVDYPKQDNPKQDNPPYNNNELNNNELSNNELKSFKNDEEENNINDLISNNVTYEFIFNFLKEKHLSDETITDVIQQCYKNNIITVKAVDVEKQYNHMIGMIDSEQRIYDFASYFVGGLSRLTETTIVNILDKKNRVVENALIKENRTSVPFYNWLEEK